MKKKKESNLSKRRIEQMFRWIRESISLMYAHHKHPVPMTALIFAYMETLGKALGGNSTKNRVKKFTETYMHNLCDGLNQKGLNFNSYIYLNNKPYQIEQILGDFYRNGLVHQFWMKKGSVLFENADHFDSKIEAPIEYLWITEDNNRRQFKGINIDFLVPDFLNAITEYQNKVMNSSNERESLYKAILE